LIKVAVAKAADVPRRLVLTTEQSRESDHELLPRHSRICIVGRRKGKDLIYAGKIDHGFDKVSAADLRKRLEPLVRKSQPYSKRIAHKGIWVEPKLLAEIEYRAKSAAGKVRHPFFRGLREDL
jgi:ATP-dependent DNA ligase